MSMLLDPFTLLLLAIAIVVIWKLRSVLGTRTGNERPPIDPFARSGKAQTPAAEPANSNVLRLPKEGGETAPVTNNAEPPPPVWTGFATEGSQLAGSIIKLTEADSSFTPKSFLEGAKLAYEMIIDGFAKGDKGALKPLLSREVYDGFSSAIDARQASGQKIDQRFVGIDKADFDQIEVTGNRAQVTIKFVSEIISATLGKDGSVVEGDPKQIRSVTDVWTFEREVTSRDPNWKLAATQAPA